MSDSVFILEDNPATAAALAKAITLDERLALAQVTHSLGEALAWSENGGSAGAALVDLGLPDGSGLNFIRHLRDSGSSTKVLVITVFGDEKNVVSAIAAGAMGYLLKDRDAQHIADSICTVLEGGSPISPSIARHLLKHFFEPASQTPSISLTPREEEVLRLVVKGFSYQEIAAGLELSIHTVTSHIQHIYRKLSVRSRGEAVYEAIHMGLVPIR